MRFVRQIPRVLGGRIGRLSHLREEEALLRQFGAFARARTRPETRFTDRPHSALMPVNLITLPHFSVSSAMSLPKSAGESASTSPPKSASRAFILGSARAALISLLSFS